MSPPIRDGSGSSIGSIRLGDGSEISEVRTGAGDVLFSAGPSTVPITSSSTLLAYGSNDSNVYVHDVGSGFALNSTLTQSAVGLRGGVSFSPDNSFIAYGDNNGNVFVHDVGGGFPLNSTLTQAGSRVEGGVSFSPDNSLIAYGDNNGDVFVHDVGSGFALNSTLTDPADLTKTLDFSAGNNFLMASEAFTGSDEIYIYDVPSLALNTSFSAATNTIFSRGSFNSV